MTRRMCNACTRKGIRCLEWQKLPPSALRRRYRRHPGRRRQALLDTENDGSPAKWAALGVCDDLLAENP